MVNCLAPHNQRLLRRMVIVVGCCSAVALPPRSPTYGLNLGTMQGPRPGARLIGSAIRMGVLLGEL